MKSSVVRKELGVKKISQKWENLVLKAIECVERGSNEVLQEAFIELAKTDSKRVAFWTSFRDKIDEAKHDANNGLNALFEPD